LQDVTYTQRHGLIRGMRRKGGLGFLPAFLTPAADHTAEAAFFSNLDLEDAVVYDIGGFQGVLTLFFSRRARHTVTYEPNPVSSARILENLRLNDVRNVTVRNVALGDHHGSIVLTWDELMAGGASGDASVSRQIARSSRRKESVSVEVAPLDDDIARGRLPPPDFIKIDIEGMELAALQGMPRTLQEHCPALYLEMHGATVPEKEENVRRIVEFLFSHGYTRILHVETGAAIDPTCAARAREGHLYCTPPERPADGTPA
jgi:FkbM family methyltransferase